MAINISKGKGKKQAPHMRRYKSGKVVMAGKGNKLSRWFDKVHSNNNKAKGFYSESHPIGEKLSKKKGPNKPGLTAWDRKQQEETKDYKEPKVAKKLSLGGSVHHYDKERNDFFKVIPKKEVRKYVKRGFKLESPKYKYEGNSRKLYHKANYDIKTGKRKK